MARYRISGPAQADIVTILETSAHRWGVEARQRYGTLLTASLRMAAAEPLGPLTRDRAEVLSGLRSFHLRHAGRNMDAKVRHRAHIIYYRTVEPGLIEIVRVLHERMEPRRHLDDDR